MKGNFATWIWLLILFDVVGKFFYTQSESINLFLANIAQDGIPLLIVVALLCGKELGRRDVVGFTLYFFVVVLYDFSLLSVGDSLLNDYITNFYTWLTYAVVVLIIFITCKWNGQKLLRT